MRENYFNQFFIEPLYQSGEGEEKHGQTSSCKNVNSHEPSLRKLLGHAILQNEGTKTREKGTKTQETDCLTQEVNGMNLQDVQEKALTFIPLHKV